jgi:hypothetical protein
MLLLAAVIALADRPSSIPWQRDHGAAAIAAEEKRSPLLIHFRTDDCERTEVGGSAPVGTTPGNAPETPRSAAGPGGHSVGDATTDCDAMEETVWSNAVVADAAARFVPVLTGDTSDRALTRRYEAATMPTTLIADPWGNEIVRLVHYVDAPRLLRILNAIPRDFSPLQPAALALRRDPRDADALLKAAVFYEGARLPEIAEKYFERATASDLARADAAVRARIGLARGTNLLRMGKPAEAAGVLRATAEGAPQAPGADAILFGWMMAELQQGRVKEAERPYRQLLARFPASKYAAKAKENFAAASKAQPPS